MNISQTIAWTANILFVIIYLLLLTKRINGEKRPYSALILAAVTLYAIYSLTEEFWAMLALNAVNMFLAIRTIYRLSFNPEKHYKYHPILFHVTLILTGVILATATKASPTEILTWVGGGFFLSAYCLLSIGKIKEEGLALNTMYIAAATLYGIWGIATNNTAIIFLETFLILVSLIAIAIHITKETKNKTNNTHSIQRPNGTEMTKR